jgi:hypothetical protein
MLAETCMNIFSGAYCERMRLGPGAQNTQINCEWIMQVSTLDLGITEITTTIPSRGGSVILMGGSPVRDK